MVIVEKINLHKIEKKIFTPTLLNWLDQNNRPLPWKGEKNPYYIWLSEIILQQTRVEQGLPYFEKFKANYPTVFDLANASEDQVMKLWEGLGYYSRARNLHFTAKYIVSELNGVFPSTYEGLLKLKGVGAYTAAAIGSFAFNLPHAVVDGNVFRVLSRIFGISTAIDSIQGKKEFEQLANELIEKDNPGIYNQAIMDFGATQCTPIPNCGTCPMKDFCFAKNENKIGVLPNKSKTIQKKVRYFNYLILKKDEKIWLNKRTGKDIWQQLYDFPLIETEGLLAENALLQHSDFKKILQEVPFKIKKTSKPFQQVLTHQKIIAVFWEIEIKTILKQNDFIFYEVEQKNIINFAFPKIVDLYFQDKSLYLDLV